MLGVGITIQIDFESLGRHERIVIGNGCDEMLGSMQEQLRVWCEMDGPGDKPQLQLLYCLWENPNTFVDPETVDVTCSCNLRNNIPI